jgi:hypothetical protein
MHGIGTPWLWHHYVHPAAELSLPLRLHVHLLKAQGDGAEEGKHSHVDRQHGSRLLRGDGALVVVCWRDMH